MDEGLLNSLGVAEGRARLFVVPTTFASWLIIIDFENGDGL